MSHAAQLRKPVTLWTNCPWLDELGVKMDSQKRERLRGHVFIICVHDVSCALYSARYSCMAGLQQRKRIRIVHHYRDRAGRMRIKGGKDLRSTEHYPHGLGLKAGSHICTLNFTLILKAVSVYHGYCCFRSIGWIFAPKEPVWALLTP